MLQRRRTVAVVVSAGLLAGVLSGCVSAGRTTGGGAPAGEPTATRSATTDPVPALDPTGWTASAYRDITEVIAAGAGSGGTAVFDFDNTTAARDITEAVAGYVEANRLLEPGSVPADLVPPVVVDGKRVTIADGPATYYNALVDSGGDDDPFREFTTLPLIADLFTGRTVADFVDLTDAAYADGAGAREFVTGGEETLAGMGRPAVYPQMADLYGNLRAHGYDVWVVSAAVGWAARWMVLNAVNPLIVQKYGPEAAIQPDHVVAVFNLMRDRTTGELVSDRQLVARGDEAYLRLEPARLRELEILALPGGVTSWRGGKVAAIRQYITRDPLYLVAGDSTGDMEMMQLTDHRLVITRLDKPGLAAAYAADIEANPDVTWMMQPVISSAPIGFLPNECVLDERTAGDPALQRLTATSLDVLEPTGTLESFGTC